MTWFHVFLIGEGLTLLAVAFLGGRMLRLRRERDQVAAEFDIQAKSLDFSDFMSEWNQTNHDLMVLFEETEIDRFLILRAWNGSLTPKWVSAVLQIRHGKQEVTQYIHTELDDDYIERLKQTRVRGSLWFATDHIADSLIKDIYTAEGVKSSVWAHIGGMDKKEDSSVVTFCSFATHSSDTLDARTVTRCRLIADQLKGMARAFHHDID